MRLLNRELNANNEVLEQRVRERTLDLESSNLETIFTMTRAAEHKDEDTGAHVQRISYYSRELARHLGLDKIFVDRIFFASPMHDIGKIGIPDHILLKPSAFTPEEWEIMQGHPRWVGGSSARADRPTLSWARRSPCTTTNGGTGVVFRPASGGRRFPWLRAS